MASKEDLFFGRLAVKRGLVSEALLTRCVEQQSAAESQGKPSKSILQILVDGGHITSAQMTELQKYQRRLKEAMIGPYRILGILGKGGMGAVYKGIVPATGLKVAIKVLPSRVSSDEILRARFMSEAELGLKLDHPNIVHTYGVGQQKEIRYIALEYVNGGDLLRRVRNGPLDEAEALRIISQMSKALQHAHSRGMIHRDIKPTNILFDQQNVAKLSDFGLAILNDTPASRVTKPGHIVGTPSYISPEQARGAKDADIRSDIYSLGATLYRIVTGKLPFEGSPIAVAAMHIEAEPVPASKLNPRLSEGCCALIRKMMAKKPDDRFSVPGEVYAEIDRILRQLNASSTTRTMQTPNASGVVANFSPNRPKTAAHPTHHTNQRISGRK